jgi:ribonuclease HI
VVKLLGIHIDQELRWKEQAAAALGKGQDWLVQFGRLARVSKGVSMKYVRRLYISIALPRMLYGADIFLAPAQHNPGATLKKDNRAVIAKISSVQRRAAVMITGAMSATPGDMLDVHANLLLVHILVDKLLHQAALRFATLPPTHPLYEAVKNAARRHVKRHLTPLHYLMNNYAGLKPHLVETVTAVRMKPSWTPRLAVRIAGSKEKAVLEDEMERSAVRVYSDGSGIEGMIGAAAVLYRNGQMEKVKRYRLGPARHHTVYEGEGIGMILGLELIREEREELEGMVPLGVDNQAAIVVTGSIKPAPSHYIWDAFHRQLNYMLAEHRDMDLLVRWTPGHADIKGNEQADEEARKAAAEGSSRRLPRFLKKPLLKSRSAMKQAYAGKLKKQAEKAWQKSPRYPRIKDMDSTLPSPAYLKLVADLPRKHCAILFQLRSGHAPLAQHLHRVQKAESPVCPCCNMRNETVGHFLLFCPAHEVAREAMYFEGGRDTRVLSKLLSDPNLLRHLFRFVARTRRLQLVYGEIPKLPDTDHG